MAKCAGAETALLGGLELDPESADGHYELAKTSQRPDGGWRAMVEKIRKLSGTPQ